MLERLSDAERGGHQVLAFNADGSFLPGWPVDVGGKVMASPAVGDVTGDGKPDVATVAEDGKLYVHRGDGSLVYSRCIANDVVNGCPIALHASASIADVDNDGHQDVVVGGEQWLNVVDGNGNLTWRGEGLAGMYPMVAAPTVVSVGGKAWIIAVSGIKDGAGERGLVFAWTTNTPLGAAAWPTFKQNFRRMGTVIDTTPPVPTLGSMPASTNSTKIPVSWSAFDNGSGVSYLSVGLPLVSKVAPWQGHSN